MSIEAPFAPADKAGLARAVLGRLTRRLDGGFYQLEGRRAAAVGLGFGHRVAWLRYRPLREGLGWRQCLGWSGWRFLITADGAVAGSISVWEAEGGLAWASHWGGWATGTADAVLIAGRRPSVAERATEPVFLRTRALRQGALWLRPLGEDEGTDQGLVMPLPTACAPLQALTMMRPADYLAALRDALARRPGQRSGRRA